jgi:hypothetical protein
MASTDSRRRVRIFLSSPGDVAEERRLAAELIDGRLRKDPGIARTCALELVRWDDPDTPTPLDGLRPPQESVNWVKGRPSECDIVVVILWSRLGSPFELDGRRWASGTQWEYEDARAAAKPPHLLVYRRTTRPQIDLDAPDFDARRAQYDGAKRFLAGMARVNDYAQPGELVTRLEAHLREILERSGAPSPHRPFASSLLDRFGVAPLAPAAFRAGAEALIASYLGPAEEPVAFGGRAAMLARLDAWLADPSSGRLLLWAPAGRGKSALVVRGLEGLRERCHPVFLPVSVRFETNRPELLYHALAARLASLLGAELPVAAGDPVGHYRGFAIDFLRRAGELDRPLLLVVDGLDEAAGWRLDGALLPAVLPPRLRVLVSARLQAGDTAAEGWLRRLGWDRPGRGAAEQREVVPLDRDGIADVLARQPADGANLPAGIDLAGQLNRLSGGDPLLVGLYLEELHRWHLAGREATAAALAALQPGFAPLFHRWLEDQERLWRDTGLAVDRDRLDLLLSLLACALGPLRHADLAALCRELRGSGFTLPRDALRPLASFLYGEGDRHGYVLSHPKLGDFLRREYFGDPAITEAAGGAFLGWPQGIVARLDAGALPPEACPTYVLLYFRQHLEAADAPLADFRALTGNGWRLARERLEGGPSGFGGDVAKVLDRARSACSAPDGRSRSLGTMLRCSLILASLNSLGANTPPELLVAWVRKGVISREQALFLGRRANARGLCAMAAGMVALLEPADRAALLAEALAAARAIASEHFRATALAGLAPHLAPSNQNDALSNWLEVAGRLDRGTLLSSVAEFLSAIGRIGGPAALDDLYRAIRQTAEWYP